MKFEREELGVFHWFTKSFQLTVKEFISDYSEVILQLIVLSVSLTNGSTWILCVEKGFLKHLDDPS